MRAIHWSLKFGTVLLVGTVAGTLLVGCNSSQSPPSADKSGANSVTLHNKADTKQLMRWVLEPHADMVWAAVGSVVTQAGEQQSAPKTDKDWNDARDAAATVAEAGNLLLVAPHTRDNGDWMAMTHKMIDEANKCVAAAEAKDIETFFTAGGDLYEACTACHAKYVISEPIKQSGK